MYAGMPAHPALVSLLLVLGSASCVGSIETGGTPLSGVDGGATTPDSGARRDGATATPDADPPDAGPTCDDRFVTGSNGVHKQGQACLTGCHTATTNGPALSVAGTLYTDPAGTAPIEGAAIHIRDADGNDLPLRTAANGNFWTDQPVRFPITAYATSCPDLTAKVNAVDQAQNGGNCNRAGCHAGGSRVHLP